MIMSTISENLQTIKNSTDAIKQAIIDKGGEISGDITTWADAISGISGGGEYDIRNFKIMDTRCVKLYINGMTWGEYINSPFNVSDTLYGICKISGQYITCGRGYLIDSNTMGYVTENDNIFPQVYSLQSGSGGGGA